MLSVQGRHLVWIGGMVTKRSAALHDTYRLISREGDALFPTRVVQQDGGKVRRDLDVLTKVAPVLRPFRPAARGGRARESAAYR